MSHYLIGLLIGSLIAGSFLNMELSGNRFTLSFIVISSLALIIAGNISIGAL